MDEVIDEIKNALYGLMTNSISSIETKHLTTHLYLSDYISGHVMVFYGYSGYYVHYSVWFTDNMRTNVVISIDSIIPDTPQTANDMYRQSTIEMSNRVFTIKKPFMETIFEIIDEKYKFKYDSISIAEYFDRYYLLFIFFYLDEIHRYNKNYIEYHYNRYVNINNKIKTLENEKN